MKFGAYDGANRNYYFQRVGAEWSPEFAKVIPCDKREAFAQGRSRKRANSDVQLHIGESIADMRQIDANDPSGSIPQIDQHG
jgi:hypothetical protein